MELRNIFLLTLGIFNILLQYGTWAKNDLIQWDECTRLLVQLRNCSRFFHVPKKCGEQSPLLECAEGSVLEGIVNCKDDSAVRIVKHYVNTYQLSDDIICKGNLHTEFQTNKRCMMSARLIAANAAATAPGIFSEKGCRVMHSAMYIFALSQIKAGCYDMLSDYISTLYNNSFCSHVRVPPPTYNDLVDLKEIFKHMITCWFNHPDMPHCRTHQSERMQCVGAVDISTAPKHFKQIVANFIEITNQTDRIICNNPTLLQDFRENSHCWSYVKMVGILVLGQANGLLTKEGCKVVKYRENITMARFDQTCAHLLLDYRKYLSEALPCAVESPAPDFAMSVHLINLELITALSLISVVVSMNFRLNIFG